MILFLTIVLILCSYIILFWTVAFDTYRWCGGEKNFWDFVNAFKKHIYEK